MEKVYIYTGPEHLEAITEAIKKEDRLDELIAFTTEKEQADIIAEEKKLNVPPKWESEKLPVLFPENSPFRTATVLGLVFFYLRNYEKAAFFFSDQPTLLKIAELGYVLQFGFEMDEEDIMRLSVNGDKHSGLHNAAIAQHYVTRNMKFEDVCKAYEKALQSSVLSERIAYTARQYATLLSDAGFCVQASQVLAPFITGNFLPLKAIITVKTLLCQNELKNLAQPYDETLMTALKNDLWECLQYYETHDRKTDAAFILMDAAHVATISKSYSEALGYIKKAQEIFDAENLRELLANTQFQKARLLHTWAQNGNPQFYREAMKACQEALKVFTREQAPDVFADIQHLLGIIYSEMPDDVKKKSVWAAVSVSSFNEALNFYNKVDYPYEFGLICNSQGNAFTKYPMALHSDNFEKAIAWYTEALDVQPSAKYPAERSITLLNYLEASWKAGNTEEDFNTKRYEDMLAKAQELKTLTNDREILNAADKHLQLLNELEKNMTAADAGPVNK